MVKVAAHKIAVELVVCVPLVIAFTPAVASAEVIGMVASVPEIWATAFIPGVLGLLAWRFLPRGLSPILGPAIAVIGSWPLFGIFGEIADPVMGPNIIAEAGKAYVLHFWAAVGVMILLHAIGVVLWVRRSPNKRFQRTAEVSD